MELLLNMTIGSTVTACLILLIKRVFKNRLTPKWHYYIWIILALRLMLPGLPESEFSLFNAMPAAQNLTTVQDTDSDSGDSAEGLSAGVVEGSVIVKSPVTGMEQRRTFSVPKQGADLLLASWIIGVVLMAGILSGAYWSFYRRTSKLPVCRDVDILQLFEECRTEAGIASHRITLHIGGSTPMLRGFIRPAILLPEGYSREEQRHVLIHELCHYKHKDILVSAICAGFLCIYWFNPVFWLCFYVIRRDIEFLCDERAIEITGERKEYSITLLKTALRRNQFIFATTSMQNGEKEVSKRIKQIAHFQKPKRWLTIFAALVALTVGAVCLTDASTLHTVNADVGGGYFVKLPSSWIDHGSGEQYDIDKLLFADENGMPFGGASFSEMSMGIAKAGGYEYDSLSLPIPVGAQVLKQELIERDDDTLILINLNLYSINQNYVFLFPDQTKNEVFSIWADSSQVTEGQLVKIAGTLQQSPNPQGYQPQTSYRDNWDKTALILLKDYFDHYAESDLPMSSDISGYRLGKDDIRRYEDQTASWSVIYDNVVVYQVDYTLEVAYPDQYSFPGGGFEIGEGKKTKIYKDRLAIFHLDPLGNAKLLGFVLPQDQEEMGVASAVLHTISYTDPGQSPAALLKLKMPYIGDHTKVGRILGSLPLASYSTGLELHTKAEPYGLIVNYDLTELGDKVFVSRPDKAWTDSSGWDLNPHLKTQLYKNSAILLALIDNCSSTELKVTGLSETGALYTYHYLKNRETLQKELSRDPRSYTADQSSFMEFIDQIESYQTETSFIKGE